MIDEILDLLIGIIFGEAGDARSCSVIVAGNDYLLSDVCTLFLLLTGVFTDCFFTSSLISVIFTFEGEEKYGIALISLLFLLSPFISIDFVNKFFLLYVALFEFDRFDFFNSI